MLITEDFNNNMNSHCLEMIVIPTGSLDSDKKRVSKAMDYYASKEQKPQLIVVGNLQKDESGRLIENSQQYAIYKRLRQEYGLKPSNLRVEGYSNNTLENFIYLSQKIKNRNVNDLKISTNFTHYLRFKLFEKQAKKEGLLSKKIKLTPLYTSESFQEFIRGIFAYVQDYLILKKTGSLENAKLKKQKKEVI